MIKTAIITEGFKQTGYGHITRCQSLYEGLNKSIFVPLLLVNGDKGAEALLNKSNYKIINWLENPESILDLLSGYDIAIIDSYLANEKFYKAVMKKVSIPVYIDDNKRIVYPAGIIINGTIGSEHFQYPRKEQNSEKGRKEYLLGTKYIPLRKEFRPTSDRKIKKEIKNILITFGGQDIRNLTPKILKMIQKEFPNIKKVVISGSGATNIKTLEKLKDNQTEIYSAVSAAKMRSLMKKSDLAISAAGQTLYELAATGTPTIAVIVADNQINNVKGWIKNSFLTNAFHFDDKDLLKSIKKEIQILSDTDLRILLSCSGMRNVDGQGVERITSRLKEKYLEKEVLYFRKATKEDSKNIYELSNEEIVRANSVNPEPIKWEYHQEWFNKRLKDKNYLFLLACDKDDNIAGQIKYDIEKNKAVVGISISPDHRGKGYASKMLIKSTAILKELHSNTENIIAYIKEENISSIKSFEKAGYQLSGKEFINENEYLKYIYEF
ncbi:MAG: bifunctional UDP-2,4-diacetamido-2,4,6-trideoxy-beta-L-altropyranose hydrolase/GNAT family N-acetyltransferase [Ignavibacteriaceae bacterium]|jgi:spore coat polysaccharide biosynthesis predicted glycosyltransferase SpsG/RimJ/RimL family protein N-acetyltransferase|nr:bifunctional UDP-2,4-diacetamido-2,4,6-trideoxy-beta-L-altropyranose hydrolase/GNAT family N-acetyltransferase [Ignavibacteriaceae bacterium]